MKKLLIATGIMLSVFGFMHSTVFAENLNCTIQNPCSNGDPNKVINGWGSTNNDVPRLVRGATVYDDGGIAATCPSWYPFDCVDLTHTSFYKDQMISIGKGLAKLGISDGVFSYWIKQAKLQ